MTTQEAVKPRSSRVYRAVAVIAIVLTLFGLGGFAIGTVVLSGDRGVQIKNAIADVTALPGGDQDHDGLSNEDEAKNHTDFWNPDSDGDGFTDGDEVKSGYNPNGAGKNDAGSISAQEILKHL